jgi:hypothetical protein
MGASCKHVCDYDSRLSYDVQISYLSTRNANPNKPQDDTLSILFDGNFNNDTVSVNINRKHFKDVILTTNEKTGSAGHLRTINNKDIADIGIRINKGKLIFIEPDVDYFNIRLTYVDSIAVIRFYRLFPAFR